MTRAAHIRAWLQAQSTPQSPAAIAAGIGEAGDIKVGHSIHEMFRKGLLEREGMKSGSGFRYRVGREPQKLLTTTPEQRRIADNERRNRNRTPMTDEAKREAALARAQAALARAQAVVTRMRVAAEREARAKSDALARKQAAKQMQRGTVIAQGRDDARPSKSKGEPAADR